MQSSNGSVRPAVERIPVHELISLEQPGRTLDQSRLGAAIEPLLNNVKRVGFKRSWRGGKEIEESHFALAQTETLF